jgi:hypothetical protein
MYLPPGPSKCLAPPSTRHQLLNLLDHELDPLSESLAPIPARRSRRAFLPPRKPKLSSEPLWRFTPAIFLRPADSHGTYFPASPCVLDLNCTDYYYC